MKIPESIKEVQRFFIKNKIGTRQTRSNLYLLRTLLIINKVKPLLRNKKIRILDLGCGHGYNTCIMNSILPESEITGIDYDKDCKKTWYLIKRKGFKIKFVNSDARRLPFSESFFDIVIMMGLLEHIGEEINKIAFKEKKLEEKRCIREVYRVLKPNGFFMINYLPNKYSYIEFITKHFLNRLNIYFHPKKFTKKEIPSLLNENDFQVINLTRVHFLPSLYYFMGGFIGDVSNKCANLLNFLDKLLLLTPLNFLAQDFEVICRKIQIPETVERHLRK
jgi:ubiquinone/menaquinone biosynthesis C-methylase UbiE